MLVIISSTVTFSQSPFSPKDPAFLRSLSICSATRFHVLDGSSVFLQLVKLFFNSTEIEANKRFRTSVASNVNYNFFEVKCWFMFLVYYWLDCLQLEWMRQHIWKYHSLTTRNSNLIFPINKHAQIDFFGCGTCDLRKHRVFPTTIAIT